MRTLAMLWLVAVSALAATPEDSAPMPVGLPVDERCRDLLVAESYGLGRTVGLAQLAERRRAWLLQEFFGDGQLFRTPAYQWAVSAIYLNFEDITNARYDEVHGRDERFDARLGIQPARRYYDSVVSAAPAAAARAIWQEMLATFEATFLVNHITTPAQAGSAVNEFARRLERTGLSQAEFLHACRQMRVVSTDAALTAEILALLEETLPAYAPAALRYHHARCLRRLGQNKFAGAVSALGTTFERQFLESLQRPFAVDLRALVDEVVLVTPTAPYPRYAPQIDRIDSLRTMAHQKDWMALFTAIGRETAERARWLVTPSLWEDVRRWAEVAPQVRRRARHAAPELETIQAITQGLAVLPLLGSRLELLHEDLVWLRQDVERMIVTGRLALNDAKPSDGTEALHILQMAVAGAETLRLGLLARDELVTKWRNALTTAQAALVSATASSDEGLLAGAQRRVRDVMPLR